MKVLYVEDEQHTRGICERFLTKEVKELYIASNGEEALRLFKKNSPNIVITDLNMPSMDGIELTAEVKKYRPETPVIVTTAFNDEHYFLRSIDVGVDKYLKKPINMKLLLSELSKFAESIQVHEKVQALVASNEEKYQIMLEEIEMAAYFQQSLLPCKKSSLGKSFLDLEFIFKPCSPVSGDFLIIDNIDEEQLVFIIIDVMGHGVASGLITIEIKTLYEQLKRTTLRPSEILKALNKEFMRLSESGFFFTATCAVFNCETSNITIASAGGVPFIYFGGDRGKGDTIHLPGDPMGLYSDKDVLVTEESYTLKQGDFLVFQTDGLIETFNERDEQYDSLLEQKNFIGHIEPHKTSAMVLKDISDDVQKHKGDDDFEDDVTILVIKKK